MRDSELNPAQQEVLDLLGAPRDERPLFDPSLRHHLFAQLEDGLGDLVPLLDPESTMYAAKHPLSQVHGCEVKYLHERNEKFEPSVPVARGAVSHKAIELGINWVDSDVTPADLVDNAIASFEHGDHWLTDWLQGASEIEHAELRSDSVERVTKFSECFPPLRRQWRPVTEARLSAEFHDGRIVLSGKVDLTLGLPDSTRAGKVVIDLKTGRAHASHRDDLRFYALIETIRLGVPPRLLATYYLDQGRLVSEAVTEDLLAATVARTIDGVRRMIELEHVDSDPVKRPGAACRWCPLLERCEEGQRTIEDLDEAEGL